MKETKKITFQEASILKHFAKLNDVKLSLQMIGDSVKIYMRDFEFNNFASALKFLQEDSRSIVRQEEAVLS